MEEWFERFLFFYSIVSLESDSKSSSSQTCLITTRCSSHCGTWTTSNPSGSSAHVIFPGKNTRMDCHSFSERSPILLQGLKLNILHSRQILYLPNHGSIWSLWSNLSFKLGIWIYSIQVFLCWYDRETSSVCFLFESGDASSKRHNSLISFVPEVVRRSFTVPNKWCLKTFLLPVHFSLEATLLFPWV